MMLKQKLKRNSMNDTCVYIHTRSDNVVFYVGIGSPDRPYQHTNRNKHWHHTTGKYAWTVTILYQNLTWDHACVLEIELIKKYREISGDKLCNQTIGGEGTKGLTGVKQSPESIEKRRVANTGKKRSEEARARMSASRKGIVFSEEHRAKIAEASRNMSPEIRAKMIASLKGRTLSEETRARMSASKKGNTNSLGVKHSPETRAKRSASLTGRTLSAEHRERIREVRKNTSPETRARMSEAAKARHANFVKGQPPEG